MSVSNAMGSALYSRLNGDSDVTGLLAGTTSIYHMQAPDNAEFPYIVFNLQAGGDENETPNRTKNNVYSVRAYSQTSAANAGEIDKEVDDALHLNTLTVAGWVNFWLARETDLETLEIGDNNEKTWMQGGFYRVRLDES